MHCNWTNLSLLIILLSLIELQYIKAAIDVYDGGNNNIEEDFEDIDEAVAKRTSVGGGWHNLQGGWGRKRNNEITEYADQTSSLGENYQHDSSKANANDDNMNENQSSWNYNKFPLNSSNNLAWKRSRILNRNNIKDAGWGKREPGNWNNLRGLWGKRSSSSWTRLINGWGRRK